MYGIIQVLVVIAHVGAGVPDDLKMTIEKAIKAKGTLTDPKKTVKVSRGEFTGNAIVHSFVQVVSPPSNVYEEWKWSENGTAHTKTIVISGKQGWIKVGDQTQEAPANFFDAVSDAAYRKEVCDLVILSDPSKNFSIAKLPNETIAGDDCVGFRVSSKGRSDIDQFYSVKSQLLIKMSTDKKFGDGKLHPAAEIYSSHKSYNGIVLPTRIDFYVDHNIVRSDVIKDIQFVAPNEMAHFFQKP